jgi:membrane fusion protein (multidrug efflux system)
MRWFIGIFLIAALAVAAYGWRYIEPHLTLQRTSAAPSVAPVNRIAVEAQRVKIGAIRRQIEAVGSLRSDESVMIRPEISGRVAEILFKEGAKVSRGDPLIRLDASIARAQLAQQAASVTLSRANQERAADLMAKGAGSPRAHDEALAKMRADEAALALAQATLDKSTLVAPFDGVLGLRRISVGDYVNPGQDIVNIENLEAMKVDFRIPEIFALQLRVGQTIRVTFDAIPDRTFEGSVYAIDPALDPNGRAVILRARMTNIDSLLRSGMFARVVLLLDDTSQSILVPEAALVPVGQEHFVFLVTEGRANLVKVKIGQRREGEVEVAEGLSREAIVVTEGALKLRDGSQVSARTAD